MKNDSTGWKIGCLYCVRAFKDSRSGDLYLNREALSRLSPRLQGLMTRNLTVTVSPDWRALNLYGESPWQKMRANLERLPTDNPEAHRIQRLMVGHATIDEAKETLTIPHTMANFAGLANADDSPLWLIAFGEDEAELWAEHELTGLDLESQWAKGPLVGFLRGNQADHQGRYLSDILALENFRLEHSHDYIQWLFPTDTPSRANLQAPVLTEADRSWFRCDPFLKFQQRRALDRMLSFCGLNRTGDIIEPLDNLNPGQHIWLKRGGHNHLRITRIIRSLHLCHQPELAQLVQQAFIELGQTRGHVQPETLEFWKKATD